jgi:hypothetical protein
MILSLTTAFQLRLRMSWKPDLKGFLIGERNLFFFTPETLVEASNIDVASIDSFLSNNSIGGRWELLGFLTPEELPAFPGYAQVSTNRESDPKNWKAKIYLMGEKDPELFPLEVRIAGSQNVKREA